MHFPTFSFGQVDSARLKFLESLSKDLRKYYVSQDMAIQMSDFIRSKYLNGGYANAENADEFAFSITQDLRQLSNDQHLTITPPHHKTSEIFDYEKISKRALQKRIRKLKKMEEEYRKMNKEDDFVYGDIKILPGNIGYVEIKKFSSTSSAGPGKGNRISINSVFRFFQETNSIMIDLRENHGGVTALGAKFCSYFANQPKSYFFTEESFIRIDSGGATIEHSLKNRIYTDENISNELTRGKGIYILMSDRTFSTAELVAYKMKQYVPAATIIGERTRGGGNGYQGAQITPYYRAIIPSSVSFDEANANYNIEGKGIVPDIFSAADSAFQVAYRLASNDYVEAGLLHAKYLKKKRPLEIKPHAEKSFSDYLGDYSKASVRIINGNLYMLYDCFLNCLLRPAGEDLFDPDDEFDYIHFVRNIENQVIQIQIKHKDGYLEVFGKR